jgi:hypothetical protein
MFGDGGQDVDGRGVEGVHGLHLPEPVTKPCVEPASEMRHPAVGIGSPYHL